MKPRDVTKQTEEYVAEKLGLSPGWTVDREPRIDEAGMLRPDLLVMSPSGHRYIVEVKVGSTGGTANLSDLAQISAYAKHVERESRAGFVVPMIATNLYFSGRVEEISNELGVKVVRQSKDARSLGQDVVRAILEHEGGSDSNGIVESKSL